MKLVNWNVEWATPRSSRRAEILRRIQGHDPEIVCLTETHTGLLSQGGHTICSQPDYGYPIKDGRRKVKLWSREPWEQVDDVGIDSMPPGRFVSGVTQTSVGEITVTGICIPWHGSRTEARRNSECKKRWEDHEQYLAGLTKVLDRVATDEASGSHRGFQSSHRIRQPRTPETSISASGSHSAGHDNRDLSPCIPGTKMYRPHCVERGFAI